MIDPDKLRALHERANSKALHPEDVAAARFALKVFVQGLEFPTLLAMAEESMRLRQALVDLVALYDDDEGCHSLPQYVAARRALGKDKA